MNTNERNQRILDRIRAGDPYKKIAADFGLSLNTIYQYASIYGVTRTKLGMVNK